MVLRARGEIKCWFGNDLIGNIGCQDDSGRGAGGERIDRLLEGIFGPIEAGIDAIGLAHAVGIIQDEDGL